MKQADVLIIGSGIAALQLANKLSDNLNVMILTKLELNKSNSYMAQGGVAAAVDSSDDPHLHYLDTMAAGSYHNDPEAVLEMTKAAPELINGLWHSGCNFDVNENQELQLGMEGAHSKKRIVHSGGDATGKHLVHFLLSTLGANVSIEESAMVYELILTKQKDTCLGVKAKLADGSNQVYFAHHIVLATGGCGQLYSFTSNAESATGDGIALAYKAGAALADMEFIQFHPTLLYVDGNTRGLVSEAVRGEGAFLVTAAGKRIMEGVHPLEDLAPRHIVSQTIYDYIKNGTQIYLDISEVADFSDRFPSINSLCLENGVDLVKGLIPIVPGSHFLMGGVRTDSTGRTDINGLYAIGEVACTGIHGANRLASNSLLEGMFVGSRLAEWISSRKASELVTREMNLKRAEFYHLPTSLPDQNQLKISMMDAAGIVRTNETLAKQKAWLEGYHFKAWLDAPLDHLPADEISNVFMYITAYLITNSALQRTESRGGHYREDFPQEDNHNWIKQKIIQQRKIIKEGHHEYDQTALAT